MVYKIKIYYKAVKIKPAEYKDLRFASKWTCFSGRSRLTVLLF